MINIEVVEDTMRFPKSHKSPSKDKNCVSYDHCKLGNFGRMHEFQIEKIYGFGPLGLTS